ncbi:MAG TPA: hypothetical protein VFG42_10200 [Baekduia sp.]|uniref:hypothetical protein n=1 Tax=Baekduia sp. TaxID=2600305 RepID=UPI002D78E72E|nr:hypothetical protein [Baekduia sp.]HET6507152.1 hypothetical protein [Baekduia sp.]
MRTPRKVSAALLGAVVAVVAALLVPGPAGALLTLGVTTKSPKDVAARSATVSAEVTVSVLGASVYWQYGTTTGYGSTSSALSSSLIGVKETLSLPLTGLTPDTTYHVRAVAASGLTTAYGADVTFKTSKATSGDDGTTTPGTAPGGGTTPGTDDDNGGSNGSGTGDTPTSSAPTTTTPTTTPTTTTTTSSHTGKTTGDDRTPSGSGSTTGAGSDAGDDDVDTPPSTDPAANVPRGEATAAVTPVLGKTLAAATVQGKVTATGPGGTPVDLRSAKAVPTGTVIDARAGTVELTTALDRKGATQTGRFWGGRFEVRQSAAHRGLTRLVLRGGDFGVCPRGGRVARAGAVAAKVKAKPKKKKPSRSLWGADDHGRFQTHGRGSVATVRGTRWLTQDTCSGTLTRVAAGAVDVHDLRTGRTIRVRAGHRYRARVAP